MAPRHIREHSMAQGHGIYLIIGGGADHGRSDMSGGCKA
jgi:hypothetical protein